MNVRFFTFDFLSANDACRSRTKELSYNCLVAFDTAFSALAKQSSSKKSANGRERSEQPHYDNEVYQAFMEGYVRRINDATLRVPIGGVRIGSAKYSRLAQINLHTHIITFSRYAIENVPERGRRYLVIHELSHVKEAHHNKRFWHLVGEHEPRYKEIGRELDQAFKKNVRSESRAVRNKGVIYQTRLFPASSYDWENYRESLESQPDPDDYEMDESEQSVTLIQRGRTENNGLLYPLDSGVANGSSDVFDCDDTDLSSWEDLEAGIIHGGSEEPVFLDDQYFDHF